MTNIVDIFDLHSELYSMQKMDANLHNSIQREILKLVADEISPVKKRKLLIETDTEYTLLNHFYENLESYKKKYSM